MKHDFYPLAAALVARFHIAGLISSVHSYRWLIFFASFASLWQRVGEFVAWAAARAWMQHVMRQ
jgi:hypothetical protein